MITININTSTLHTANDNGSVPLCEGCRNAPAATKDHMLCAACAADVSAHIDGTLRYVGDPEGECFDAGINTDPRY